MAGHFRQGRIYRPPLLAFPQSALQDWVRDDLPDLIWPVLVIAQRGDGAAGLFGRFQTAAYELTQDATAVSIDGRLTSAERVPQKHRRAIVSLLEKHRQLFPPELVALLGLYPGAPGSWLFRDPWLDADPTETPDALASLAKSIVRVVSDPHFTALVQFVPLAWTVASQTGSFDRSIVDLLCDYPSVPSKFDAADSVIRASFGARRGALIAREGDSTISDAIQWARRFWATNWQLTPCMPEEDAHDGDHAQGGPDLTTEAREHSQVQRNAHTSHAGSSRDDESDDLDAQSHDAQQEIVGAFNSFLDLALDPMTPIDLYAPARHEVVTGLASRAARAVLAFARNPELWSGEQSSHITRLLAETEIVLRWMERQGDEVFERFKRYGAGKRKLMRIHLTDFADQHGETARIALADALDHLTVKTGGEDGEWFQEVNLDSTFAGLSLREMATQCECMDLYRHLYQPTSGITHGEWWALEDYAMQRCMNPLHRFHSIPSFHAQFPPTADFGNYLVGGINHLLSVAKRMLVETGEEVSA